MNDGSADMSVEEFVENNKQIIKLIKDKNPDVEFVLISPPVPNKDCKAVYKEQANYKKGLQSLVSDGIAMINMTDVFLELLKKKRYCEISGNNLNHPNDFGYKFYTDAFTYLFYQLKVRNENRLTYKEYFSVPTFEEKEFNLPDNIKGGYIVNNIFGKECKTFVFVGFPKGAKGKLPAVVLAHGGGGNAYWKWVEEWTKLGYVAISMDLNCTHFVAGLDERVHNDLINDKLIRNYVCVNEPPEQSWTYYSVAQIISAHSYILSLPNVDKERTGVVGISWGGVMSLMATGIDKRFSLASIIYSAGFISEDLLGEETGAINTLLKKDYYDTVLDPRNYVGEIDIPVLFNAGLTDGAFSPFCRKRTYDLLKCDVYLSIKDELLHDNESNFSNHIVATFFDDILNKKIRPSLRGKIDSGKLVLTASCDGFVEVYYTAGNGNPHELTWEKEGFYVKKGEIVYDIKEGVKHITASLLYGDGLYVSCDLFSI
jgi:cephalosporin-C deacetylase-like acetyl esterase